MADSRSPRSAAQFVMARYTGKKRISPQTRDEALSIAEGTQRPGQTKDQTKLIAQGIQRGIDLYKKQHKTKARELDRKLRRTDHASAETAHPETHRQEVVRYRVAWLPWTLLVVTWIGIGLYVMVSVR
jgi:hypothetical protein